MTTDTTSNNNTNLWLSYLPVGKTIPKALYSDCDNNRLNLYESGVLPEAKKRSDSIACLVKKDLLALVKNRDKGTYEMGKVRTLKVRIHGFQGQFQDEISPGVGTAFLVGDRLALTAGHCVCREETDELDTDKIQKTRLIFGLTMLDASQISPIIKDRVCKILKVVKYARNEGEGDWALVELKKHPKDVSPLPIDFTNVVQKSLRIYMLGHPSGLPMKFTGNGKVVENHPKQQTTQFEAAIDAFAGNSGSPIFNEKTHKVIGILVAGRVDYEYDRATRTIATHRVTQQEINEEGYEKCQRITVLPEDVIDAIDPRVAQKRQTVISTCQTVQDLIRGQKNQEAIDLLKTLPDDDVQAVNLALAALVETHKKEKYKQKSLASGFIDEQSIDEAIHSVLLIPVAESSASASGNVVLPGGDQRTAASGPGSSATADDNIVAGTLYTAAGPGAMDIFKQK